MITALYPLDEKPPHAHLLIDGRLVPSTEDRGYLILSPATGDIVGRAAAAQLPDLDLALESAQRAFIQWSNETAYAREATIRKAVAQARQQARDIGRLMALEQGKPWNQATKEVLDACDLMEFYAAEGVRIEGTIHPTENPSLRSWAIHQPVGVTAALLPWNYPVALLSWKLGPALAAGCSMVVKPSPATPLCVTAFCLALAEGGLPPGVCNVLPSPSPELGALLVQSPIIRKIAMTGSSDSGKRVMQACAESLKRVSLELGGHCPAIVCEDADLDLAAQVVAYKGFRNSGQSCSSLNRVLVHRSVQNAFTERLLELAQGLSMGDGLSNPSVDLGPMTTRDALENTEDHVKDALDHGAIQLCGGRPEHTEFRDGHYFLPTILVNCEPSMKLWREETFGPVVPMASFDELERAIEMANDSRYGLVSYLFSRNLDLALQVSERLESGTVCVNHGAVNTAYGPYEGWKDSGFGLELSRKAIFEYLQTKHIKVSLSTPHLEKD
jgi:acyl-CoA reductase-like NAD-dependent aldehyde dehydrogenase